MSVVVAVGVGVVIIVVTPFSWLILGHLTVRGLDTGTDWVLMQDHPYKCEITKPLIHGKPPISPTLHSSWYVKRGVTGSPTEDPSKESAGAKTLPESEDRNISRRAKRTNVVTLRQRLIKG